MKRVGLILMTIAILSCNSTANRKEKAQDDYQPPYNEGFFYKGYKHYTFTPPKYATSDGDEILFEFNKHKGNSRMIQDDEFVQEISFSLPDSKSFSITEKDSISISYQYICFCFHDSTYVYPTVQRFKISGQQISDSIWDVAGIVLLTTDTILFNEKFKFQSDTPKSYVTKKWLGEIQSWNGINETNQ